MVDGLPTDVVGCCRSGSRVSQFVAALAEIDTLDTDTAANAVEDWVGALEALPAEIMALHDAGITPTAASGAAFDYLLAALQAEVWWLRGFATSLSSGRVRYRQAVGPETGSRDGEGEMTAI
ncbi:MAG: hypothetical protein J2P16_09905 [Mycobacterium sp.]|nr:hypothetical protein [Mycobacterium sp.]